MQKYFFKIVLTLFLSSLLYFILVIIDIILPRIPKIYNENVVISKNIIQNRIIKDIELIEKYQFKKKYISMIFPSSYNYYPLNKIVKKKNFINYSSLNYTNFILCSEGYGIKKFKSDRFGFRNPDHLWDEKIDTVIIGDSFVEGMCVDYDQTLAGILNNKNIKTISLSNGGNSSIHYAALAKIYLSYLKPKNVILLFFENDNSLVDSTELHRKYYQSINKEDYITQINGKIGPSKKVNEFNEEISNYIKKDFEHGLFFYVRVNLSKLKKYLLLTHLREYFYFIFFKNEIFDTTKFAINEVNDYCLTNNCNTYFGILRSSNFWDPRYFYKDFKISLSKYLQKSNKGLIYFDDILKHDDKSNYAPKGPHFSIKSYEIISNRLLNEIGDAFK